MPNINLFDEEKWKALLECDPTYDGRFFYGVKTTGIFCRPSCKSKSPKRENVVFFDTAEEAREGGLRPCKRCRPDLLEFQPLKETAEKMKAICEQYFLEHNELKKKLSDIGLSRNRMTQVFQAQYGKTPAEYVNQLRVERCKMFLTDTRNNILQIALQSGFESLSTFYTQFRKVTGMSPKEYRENLAQHTLKR
jgi:AraC family transcriptional regulator of adaptative response / methylphosphotriester-DNA alkyltransferase methyltransferase